MEEFIKVLKALENYSEVRSIDVIQGSLKEFSDAKRFVYLSDSVSERNYVIAEINLFPNIVVSVIEVECEDRALSTLICFLNHQQSKSFYYQQILFGLIDSHGTWDIEQLQFYNIDF
ncbi:Tn7-like element transposition protein TnsE [Bacillus amyloliquefaciens]|uniref:Tn7-like element transposition protein TnsE n=1 Tax=Bacillus amyloliquefaciens TaxID=1390 RepID=UPI003C72ED3F